MRSKLTVSELHRQNLLAPIALSEERDLSGFKKKMQLR